MDHKALFTLAATWAPYRSTAALLFWRFYAAVRQRQGVPV
jgi:DNA-3-methyladenine glycosylase II